MKRNMCTLHNYYSPENSPSAKVPPPVMPVAEPPGMTGLLGDKKRKVLVNAQEHLAIMLNINYHKAMLEELEEKKAETEPLYKKAVARAHQQRATLDQLARAHKPPPVIIDLDERGMRRQ